MIEIKVPQFIRKLKSLGGEKLTEEKDKADFAANANQSFELADSASSNYGIASVKINSVQPQKRQLTPQQVEKILKGYLKNDTYDIHMYRELFSNLDKLDYENIDAHLKNIKTFFGMRTNFPDKIVQNGYFYSKEGAQAFEMLSSILSGNSRQGFVSPLSIALSDYDVKSVLILQKRGLLTPEQIDNSTRLNKFAKMDDEEYSSYQSRVDKSIKDSGLPFEVLSLKLKQKVKGSMDKSSFEFFSKNFINRESVVSQLDILNQLKNFPIEFKDFDLESLLSKVDIDNVHIYKSVLNEVKNRSDIDARTVLDLFHFANKNNEKSVLELLKNEDIPLFKINEYCQKDENFINGLVPSETMIERINNDSYLMTVRAIENTQVDLTPANTTPTKLNPRMIIPSSLALVHMTKYPPENGVLLSTRDKLGGSRNSVHFTLNHAVTSHRGGDWEKCDYAVIMPYESTVKNNETGKFIEGMPNDIYTNGSVKIPEGAVILKYNPDIKDGSVSISDHPEIKGAKYIESSIYPHELIPTILKKMGYSHMQGDGPIGMFSYGKDNGKNIDDAIKNYSAWKTFCDQNGLKPTRHTGSAGDIAEKIVENVGKLCVHNSWHDVRNLTKDYKKELLSYLDIAKDWTNKGYFVSYDIDAMKNIIKESATPKDAVEKMKTELGFHPTLEYKYFNDCTFSISVDLYSTWHDMSDNLGNLRKYLKEEDS